VINHEDRPENSQPGFNKGSAMNAGFLEAMQDFNWTCIVLHDVDLLPDDDTIMYNCPKQPRS
jgi:hypothetical protein